MNGGLPPASPKELVPHAAYQAVAHLRVPRPHRRAAGEIPLLPESALLSLTPTRAHPHPAAAVSVCLLLLLSPNLGHFSSLARSALRPLTLPVTPCRSPHVTQQRLVLAIFAADASPSHLRFHFLRDRAVEGRKESGGGSALTTKPSPPALDTAFWDKHFKDKSSVKWNVRTLCRFTFLPSHASLTPSHLRPPSSL